MWICAAISFAPHRARRGRWRQPLRAGKGTGRSESTCRPSASPVTKSPGVTKAFPRSSAGRRPPSSRSWTNTARRNAPIRSCRRLPFGCRKRKLPRLLRISEACGLPIEHSQRDANREKSMTSSNRRQFLTRIERARRRQQLPDAGAGASQAEAGGRRRRSGRRHDRQIRRQGFQRRGRGHAGRAAAAVHDLLPFQPLSRRVPQLGIDHPFLRCAGIQVRRQAGAPGGAGDRSREEERPSRRRVAARLRSAGGGARDRHQVRFGAGLFRGGLRRDAARLEAGAADPAAQAPARRGRGRRGHRDDRAAQSLSLPARSLRARLDDGARAQGQGTQELAHHHPRSQGDVLEAGAVPGGLGEALSGDGRVAGPEDARRHQAAWMSRP